MTASVVEALRLAVAGCRAGLVTLDGLGVTVGGRVSVMKNAIEVGTAALAAYDATPSTDVVEGVTRDGGASWRQRVWGEKP